MEKNFRMTRMARSVGLVLGGSLIVPHLSAANTCTLYSAGTCGLKEMQVTSSLNPKPTAWYFSTPTQDAAINGDALAKSIYFASGTSSRGDNDIQNLLVDGAKLDNAYINASKKGMASITLANNASVDWLEAGGGTTHLQIKVDHSTINGAQEGVDYDKNGKTPASKNYAKGSTLYLSTTDNGNQKIDIVNGSVLNGRLLTGGGGIHDINIEDSQINKGGVVISGSRNNNSVRVKNSRIDTNGAVVPTDKALHIASFAATEVQHDILLENSQLNGSISVTNSKSGVNNLTLNGSTVNKTTNANGDAIIVGGGTATRLASASSTIEGNTTLTSTDSVQVDLQNTQLNGNMTLNKAAQASVTMANSTLDGALNASGLTGHVDLKLSDNAAITGDVILAGDNVQSASVLLDNARIGGHLYGGANSALTLARSITSLDGSKFSNLSKLNIVGQTAVQGGFTDSNVGQALQVNGGRVTAAVDLSQGKLMFNAAQIMADTLSLRDSASLELNNHSLLQTHSAQLFNQDASTESTDGFNDTGSRLRISDSTLVLTDDTYQLGYVKSINQLLEGHTNGALVMTGQLVNGDTAVGTVTIADAAIAGAVLAGVQVTADKNHLVIGASGESLPPDTIGVEKSFGAAQLMLEGTQDAQIDIIGGQSLTLTGAMGGALIGVAGAPDASVNLNVTDGALNLGARATGNTSGTLHGNISVASDSEMNVIAGHHSVTSGNSEAAIVSSGTVNIYQHAVFDADLALQNAAQLNVQGALNATRLTAEEDAMITVGSTLAAGSLVVGEADLQGARMFIDPAWKSGATLKDASQVVMAGREVNGRLTTGRNALLVLGDTSSAAAIQHFADSKLTWGKESITAALAINAPQTLVAGVGGLRIDGSLTTASVSRDATADHAEFGEQSLLMVNASSAAGKGALNATDGTLKVADSAALYIADAKANKTYTIANGFSDIQREAHGWQGSNLVVNKLLNATTQESNGAVRVTTTAKASQVVLPGVAIGNALNSMISSGSNSLTSPHASIRLLSTAVEDPNIHTSEVIKTINSVAQLAIAGGVQSSTLATGTAAARAIQERMSISSHGLPQDEEASVWAHALYGTQRSRDLNASRMTYGYDTDFAGLMAGSDVAYDNRLGTMRSGVAVHAGNGETNSTGDFNATNNDFSFWGISLYQNWASHGVNVTADVGYSENSNELEQRIPAWTQLDGRVKGSVDSQLFTVGVTGEYLINTPWVEVIPHVGARFNQLTTRAFDTHGNRHDTLFKTDQTRQDIWQFPAGVKLNKAFALDAGWDLRAQADIGMIAASGDTRTQSRVYAPGIHASDVIAADVVDSSAFNGQMGLTLQKGNMTFGVGYNITASENSTAQTVGATYKLSF